MASECADEEMLPGLGESDFDWWAGGKRDRGLTAAAVVIVLCDLRHVVSLNREVEFCAKVRRIRRTLALNFQ